MRMAQTMQDVFSAFTSDSDSIGRVSCPLNPAKVRAAKTPMAAASDGVAQPV